MAGDLASSIGTAMDDATRRALGAVDYSPEAQRIAAITAQQQAEQTAADRASLQSAINTAATPADKQAAQKAMDDWLLDQEKQTLQASLDQQKANIQASSGASCPIRRRRGRRPRSGAPGARRRRQARCVVWSTSRPPSRFGVSATRRPRHGVGHTGRRPHLVAELEAHASRRAVHG